MIDALLKARPANTTDVVIPYDYTSKGVTVRCAKGTVLELRGDTRRMFVTLTIHQSELLTKKGFTLALP